MRLATRLALKIAALLVALVLIGGAALWGLTGLVTYFDATSDEYEQLRTVYQVGHHASVAQLMLAADAGDLTAVRRELSGAIELTDRLLKADTLPNQRRSLAALHTLLSAARAQLMGPGAAALNVMTLRVALSQVADLAGQIQGHIVETRTAAAAHLHTTILSLSAMLIGVIVLAVAIAISQYRSVVGPLRQLERGVSRAAAANFSERMAVEGDVEFAQLARQFNQMAEQLQTLYRSLEQQVLDKSKQLVQSERLAGVGYLAAGLAHEINNPLAIIGGYAEAALKQMPSGDESRAAKALRIIAEEAFRCKQITTKLLSLARPQESARSPVNLSDVLGRVASLVGGLPQFAKRSVTLRTSGELVTLGNEAELTQVFINLISNALEAVSDGGRVIVEGERRGPWVTVRVIDDGRGMTEEVSRRVFEPFFTDKPQRDERGTGLGLAVTHAIVTQHGGRIAAHSEGPGKGSVFTVELPGQT
jgi:signal transduction histidine kinase